jgi:hypothetical protein
VLQDLVLSEVETLAVLGAGGFGKVTLVRCKGKAEEGRGGGRIQGLEDGWLIAAGEGRGEGGHMQALEETDVLVLLSQQMGSDWASAVGEDP